MNVTPKCIVEKRSNREWRIYNRHNGCYVDTYQDSFGAHDRCARLNNGAD